MQDEDSPVIVARFHKDTPGLNPRREFSPQEFILNQFRDRKAESRANEAIAESVRTELASISPLELRPEILRQYSSLGYRNMGEHGEYFASVVSRLVRQANQDYRWKEAKAQSIERTTREISNLEAALQKNIDDPRNAEQISEFIRHNQSRLDAEITEVHDRVGSADGLTDAERRTEAIKAWLSELTPRAITEMSVVSAPTGEAIVAVREEGCAERITARSMSDGTLRFAALSVALIGAEGEQTLVIEEIENGVSPARLEKLIRMVEQAVESLPSLQVVASTHSSTLLDFCSEETINGAVVMGWDSEDNSSRPMLIRNIQGINEATDDTTIGTLQAEGWLQIAAGK